MASPAPYSSKYSDLRQSQEEFNDVGTPRGLPPPPARYNGSSVRIMMCLGFLGCLVCVAFGFFMGTYGYTLGLRQARKFQGHDQTSAPKNTVGLGMATIDELPFITDGISCFLFLAVLMLFPAKQTRSATSP